MVKYKSMHMMLAVAIVRSSWRCRCLCVFLNIWSLKPQKKQKQLFLSILAVYCLCVLERFFFNLTYCIYSNIGTTTSWEATNRITARILCAKNVPTICLWGCVWGKANNSEIFHIDSWLSKCYFSLVDHRIWHTQDLFLFHILTVVCQRSLSYF